MYHAGLCGTSPPAPQVGGETIQDSIRASAVCLFLSIRHPPPIPTLQICPVRKHEFKSLSTLSLLTSLQPLSLCLICLRSGFGVNGAYFHSCLKMTSLFKIGKSPNISGKLLKPYSLRKALNLLNKT